MYAVYLQSIKAKIILPTLLHSFFISKIDSKIIDLEIMIGYNKIKS